MWPKDRALSPVGDRAMIQQLALKALAARRFILKLGFEQKIRLHYGATMSIVEILTLLYHRWMTIDPSRPSWQERDRFVLSKGHAAPALYAVLSSAGFFPESEFDNFRRIGSRLQGHPDRNKTPGVDCSTGSLGQGLPVACGMALCSKIDEAPYKVYACIGDGECNEGSIWEAALIASNLGLDRLIVLLDRNKKSSYGVMKGRNDVEPLADKWRAFNWAVFECDGHDYVSLSSSLCGAETTRGRPSVILCNTVKGKGIPLAENTPVRSNFYLEPERYREALESLDKTENEIRHDRQD